MDAVRYVWNLPASIGILHSMLLKSRTASSYSSSKVYQALKGEKSDPADAKWIAKSYAGGHVVPSFIPPKSSGLLDPLSVIALRFTIR